ncbi:hypothetical protein [Yinghuangia seranimata]|uniref:hypothetical protein n=1 Tax=Yinghuangia seranimata TaxID=408067 RepID=UPI00248BAE39|nr:hypothetical protein [Yinghuangia seranimata]MDI2127165.1 hypothetical protein [Yinghuangia seranimata]
MRTTIDRGIGMDLEFVAVDDKSEGGTCPTIWVDKDTGNFVFQGFDAPADMLAACLAQGPVPEGESVVHLPRHMADAIRRACELAERADVG